MANSHEKNDALDHIRTAKGEALRLYARRIQVSAEEELARLEGEWAHDNIGRENPIPFDYHAHADEALAFALTAWLGRDPRAKEIPAAVIESKKIAR